jgi:hypothetical protein
MRNLVISKLTEFIEESCGEGIPRYFDCEISEYLKDPKELESLSDEKLLEAFESCVGFSG